MQYIDYVSTPWVFGVLIPNFFKMAIMIALFFYWVPSKIFPQIGIKDWSDKVMFNVLYMLIYIEIMIPFMLLLGIYSFPLFLVVLVLTKLVMMKYYHKITLSIYFFKLHNHFMTTILNILDNLPGYIENNKQRVRGAIQAKINTFSWVLALEKSVLITLFMYPVFLITLRGFLTFSYGAPDTAQFFEWVSFLYKGELFYAGKTAGADFYGTTIFVFFISNITNSPIHVVFSLYPFFTVLFLMFGLFYFVKKFTDSAASGVFAVFFIGVVLMTPWIINFVGHPYLTTNPEVAEFLGLKFHLPWPIVFDDNTDLYGIVPYSRNSCGLPYELAYMFFLPNLYFFIKAFSSDEKKYVWWYGVTLILVFTFHGGIAFYLVAASIPITLWAIVNGKLTWQKLKLGLTAIVSAAVIGNLWLVSILEYGGLGNIGAAAPIIDSTLKQLGLLRKSAGAGQVELGTDVVEFEHLQLLLPSHALLVFAGVVLVLFSISVFFRRRYEIGAYALVAIGVLFVYFATVLGLPKLVDPSRNLEAVLLSWSIIAALLFYWFIAFPLTRLVQYNVIRGIVVLIAFSGAVMIAWIAPKWIETTKFWKELNDMEYSDFAYSTYQIKQDFEPYTWTIVSYNPEYAEVLTKGYHVNTQDFLRDYEPYEHFLRIPTPTIFFFVETRSHDYKGLGEWYYKWRPEVQENFQTWLMMYQLSHPEKLKVYYESEHCIIYQMDNKHYMKKLEEDAKKKKVMHLKTDYFEENNFNGSKNEADTKGIINGI
ncbi:hypothetical protein [Sulfuricurvum sp.]|uniref:hypothetical protein n=1 Tax=Sulfuricurvum sp. TaxID=2025608 RepID=UPI003BB6E9CB